MALLLLFLLVLPIRLDAAQTSSEAPSRGPALSSAGKQKAADNQALLESNLAGVSENLETTRKNLTTIQAELEELEALERRHLALKMSLEKFLARASAEFRENTSVLETGKADQKNEAEQRANWKLEAEARLAKAQNSLHELNVNLAQVQSRKEPLRGQLQAWRERERELERLRTDLASLKDSTSK